MCRMTMVLFFSNGQKATMQASGFINIVKPSIENHSFYLYAQWSTNSSGETMYGDATFNAWVRPPPSFSGTASFIQLVDTSYDYFWPLCHPHWFTTANGYWLDNGLNPYAAQHVSWNDNPLSPVVESDTPGLDRHSYCYSMSDVDAFKTYLQFCPDGGIPVTIASLTWGWGGTASETGGIWSGSASPSGPAVNWNDHSFPLWTNVYHNGE
jgi:hypothetical protein